MDNAKEFLIEDGVLMCYTGSDSHIIIPDGVTRIESHVFNGRTDITSIILPNSVTSIGSGAFSYCDSLMSITFEGTVKEWNAISKDWNWNNFVPATEVICSDGKVAL